jgi:hypothetical protein
MDGEIFIPIFLFGSIALVLYKFFDTRHRERMAMIEKGLTPAEMASVSPRRFLAHPLTNLKWGLLALFVGLGVFIGNFIHESTTMDDGPAFFGSIFISGGLALVVYYVIAARKLKNEGE